MRKKIGIFRKRCCLTFHKTNPGRSRSKRCVLWTVLSISKVKMFPLSRLTGTIATNWDIYDSFCEPNETKKTQEADQQDYFLSTKKEQEIIEGTISLDTGNTFGGNKGYFLLCIKLFTCASPK